MAVPACERVVNQEQEIISYAVDLFMLNHTGVMAQARQRDKLEQVLIDIHTGFLACLWASRLSWQLGLMIKSSAWAQRQ